MALAEIQAKIKDSKIFHFYAHLLNEYAKEEEEKNKTTDWPRIILKKKGEYNSFSISLTYQMIESGFSNVRCLFIR